MLRAEHISFSYRNKQVLRDVCLTAKEGDFIGIIGKNGCGKSTLLSVLAGVKRPDSGTLSYQDAPLYKKGSVPAKLVGYVPQLNPLLPELSVQDNLKLWFREATALPKDALQELYDQMGLTECFSTAVKKLSEGMKKRVSIASVLQNAPSILILDEPSAALDLPCKEVIHAQLLSFVKKGGIIFFTTHEEAEFSLCTTLYILKDGVLQQADVHSDKSTLIQQF
ncbi:MAG: ATP-binding cassette domain-containing protein [Lachnospiraceae bacterium]|nr:ATP-binding cassette domain-containing protein [Lachnospiraceae bacterium]